MSRRRAFHLSLAFGLAALAAAPTALGQSGALDKVHYRDADGKVVAVDAAITESAAGVQLVTGTKALISPADVFRIDYGDPKGIAKVDQFAAITLEDGRDPVKARDTYAGLLKKAGLAAPERTKRYLSFREAIWAGKAADAKTGAEFQAEAPKAAEALAGFARANKTSWEVWPTARAAARLYAELGDHAKAAALLGELVAVKGLPRDLHYEAALAEAGALIRAGQRPDAEKRLDQLEKDKDFPATGPARDRLTVLRVAAKAGDPAKLDQVVAKVTDPTAKAVGVNFLGDAQLAAGKPREAMWSYLWADVVYNQDKGEQVYAVGKLVGVFEALGDKDRAEQFRDRLPRVR
ncbi:MAG TPA: hypothetical protein VFG68_18280 [Fimbriiglobus sp.]|nr:hypothetical protein [Fimbriiglobus sp.]